MITAEESWQVGLLEGHALASLDGETRCSWLELTSQIMREEAALGARLCLSFLSEAEQAEAEGEAKKGYLQRVADWFKAAWAKTKAFFANLLKRLKGEWTQRAEDLQKLKPFALRVRSETVQSRADLRRAPDPAKPLQRVEAWSRNLGSVGRTAAHFRYGTEEILKDLGVSEEAQERTTDTRVAVAYLEGWEGLQRQIQQVLDRARQAADEGQKLASAGEGDAKAAAKAKGLHDHYAMLQRVASACIMASNIYANGYWAAVRQAAKKGKAMGGNPEGKAAEPRKAAPDEGKAPPKEATT